MTSSFHEILFEVDHGIGVFLMVRSLLEGLRGPKLVPGVMNERTIICFEIIGRCS